MNKTLVLVAGSLLAAGQFASAEEALDMSKPLFCGATLVTECVSGGECVRGTPDHFNLPVLLRIDIANKQILSARVGGERRVSDITSIANVNGVSVLQGVDGDAGWSATIVQSSGKMTVSSARPDLSHTVFGSCASL